MPRIECPNTATRLYAQVESDRLEVVGEDVEVEVGGFAGRASAAAQVDVDELEAVAQGRTRLPLIRASVDATQHETRRPVAARCALSRLLERSEGRDLVDVKALLDAGGDLQAALADAPKRLTASAVPE